MSRSELSLIEFPADDPERARRFWTELLGVELKDRQGPEGEGWQTHAAAPAVGVHERGPGPGDSFSLPYFAVADIAEALERVEAAARGTDNLMPPVLTAVKAYATLGEICDVFRKVWGQYREGGAF